MSMTKEEIIIEATRAAGVAADMLAQALNALNLATSDSLPEAEAALVRSRTDYAASRGDWDASKQAPEPEPVPAPPAGEPTA